MSAPITPKSNLPAPAPLDTSSNRDKALAHIKLLEEDALKYKGKAGLNPFVFLNRVVYPEYNKIMTLKGELSKEELERILNIKSPENYTVKPEDHQIIEGARLSMDIPRHN